MSGSDSDSDFDSDSDPPSWGSLFERAAEREASVDSIREALARRRDDR